MFELHAQLQKDCVVVGDFTLCRVLLLNDSQYPWFILVPRRAPMREGFELADDDRAQFHRESDRFAALLADNFAADKLNIAALGNMVPQLHVHHIVRYQTDPAWPAPVWGKLPAKPYEAAALQAVLDKVRIALRGECGFVEEEK